MVYVNDSSEGRLENNLGVSWHAYRTASMAHIVVDGPVKVGYDVYDVHDAAAMAVNVARLCSKAGRVGYPAA